MKNSNSSGVTFPARTSSRVGNLIGSVEIVSAANTVQGNIVKQSARTRNKEMKRLIDFDFIEVPIYSFRVVLMGNV